MGLLFDESNPIYNALILYLIVMVIVLLVKPKIMYDKRNKRFKTFGYKKHQTLCSFTVFAIISSISFYLLSLIICLYCKKK